MILFFQSTEDRAALYSMPAYTQLTLEQAQLIFDTFRPTTPISDQSATSSNISTAISQRRFEVIRIKELMGGLSNSNYRFEVLDHLNGTTTKMLLKVCEEKNETEVGYQLRALDMMRTLTLEMVAAHPSFPRPCPIAYPYPIGISADAPVTLKEMLDQTPLPGSDFLFHVPSITTRPLVFYAYLDGRMVRDVTPELMHEVARAQAQLHSVPIRVGAPTVSSGEYDFTFLPATPFGMFAILEQYETQVVNNPSPVAPTNWQDHPFITFLRTQMDELRTAYESASSLPESIIHSDLFCENMIFSVDGSKLLGLIDFEEMGRGPRILDVAMTIVGCCYDEKNRLNLSLAKSFLNSYVSFIPFTANEKSLFRQYLIWSILAIAYWRWQNFNVVHQEPNQRKDAYLHMQRRVEELNTEEMKKQFEQIFHQ